MLGFMNISMRIGWKDLGRIRSFQSLFGLEDARRALSVVDRLRRQT